MTSASGYSYDSESLRGNIYANMSQNISTTAGSFQANSTETPMLKQPMTMVIVLSLAYILVFLLAMTNNSLVVTVIYKNPQMRTVTNYFLANLAVADIMVSILVLPITLLSNLFKQWLFGPFVCKAAPYLQGVAVSASVNTLAAVAVERYLAIFYPQFTLITPQLALIIISVIWFLPVCIMVPWAVVYTEKTFTNGMRSLTVCFPQWGSQENRKGFFLGAVFLTCYLIPLTFICICYSMIGIKVWKRSVAGIRGSQAERNIQRSKIRIVRMLIVVAVMFALSWLPLYSLKLRLLFFDIGKAEKNVLYKLIVPIAQWIGSANSCVNPIIYCYFSEQFRRNILALLKSKPCGDCSKGGGRKMSTASATYTKTAVTSC